MHADKALYSPGYLAFYVKPLYRISASCWMQVGCGTYLLQPRCACNPSLSPLPPSCSGGCLEHGPRLCICVRACLYVRLSMLNGNCHLLPYAHVYMYVRSSLSLSLSLSLCLPPSFFFWSPEPVVCVVWIKVVKGLSEVLYMLMIAAHLEHLQSTFYFAGPCKRRWIIYVWVADASKKHSCLSCGTDGVEVAVHSLFLLLIIYSLYVSLFLPYNEINDLLWFVCFAKDKGFLPGTAVNADQTHPCINAVSI